MIVAPIVFCVVVHGIAGAGDLKKVGRVGVKALIYFEVMTTVALTVGLVLAFLFAPGHGMNIDPATLDPKALSNYADNAQKLQGARRRQLHPQHHPDDVDRRAGPQRRAAGAVLRHPVRRSLALVGEPAQQVTSMIEAVVEGAVQGHGADRARRAARRSRRGRLYGRQIRRRLAQAACFAGVHFLRLRSPCSWSSCSAACCASSPA